MAGADTIERLRQFLRELGPQARSLLIGELERSLLRGDAFADADLTLHEMLLQELRCVLREQREGAARIGHAARLFFKPLTPFLVDAPGDHNHPGRIARSSLELLWTWIRRDLATEDAIILSEEVNDALLASNDAKVEELVSVFQSRIAAVIDLSFESAATDEKIQRRMQAQIGTPRAIEDATILRDVLKRRDALAALAARLPLRIGNLAHGSLDECKALIESTSARDGDMFLYAFLTVMSRLAAPWQLVRLGTKAAGCDTAARVAESHYGVTVTIVLAELDRMMAELAAELRSGRSVAIIVLLKAIHDCARGLRTELDLPIDSTWGRALSALRSQISDLLRAQIESVPGRVRRLLRPRPSSEIKPNSVLDGEEVADTESLVEFVGACRHFANELAINEMTQTSYAELQQYLDGGMRALLDGVRHAGAADRSFRQSQVDAAVRFCAKVFGPEYASLMGKAAVVATAGERKMALA